MSELITKLNPALVAEAMQAPSVVYQTSSEIQLQEGTYKSHFYNADTQTGVVILDDSIILTQMFRNSDLCSVQLMNVTSIGESAFEGCDLLESITIPNSITKIGDYAFRNCNRLTRITIPDSVTSIGSRAFYNCTSLTDVYCKRVIPPSVTSSTFIGNAADCKIYVPNVSVDVYKSEQFWNSYADQIVGVVFEDEVLESGINVKTINGQSILGEGNIDVLSSVNIATTAEIEALFTNNSSSES